MKLKNYQFFAGYRSDFRSTPDPCVKGRNEAKNPRLPKDTPGVLINVHIKFQFLSSIWRGVMRGINSKNEKERTKNLFCEAVRGCTEAEKSRPPKGTSRALYEVYIANFKFLNQFGGELLEKQPKKKHRFAMLFKPDFRGKNYQP